MNLLKQTALVLGLASLSIGGWTLYRNWRQRVALMFAMLCFLISIWALSFVSHVTLAGRLSRDIHWFINIWLAPVGVSILSQLLAMEDIVSRTLKWVSLIGAIVLSAVVAFSISSSPWVMTLVMFWPSFVLLEYLYLMIQDLVLKRPVNVDFISVHKRKILYLGLGISLLTCNQDHIPAFGYVIPAIGNLLFTAYLLFLAQLITPQRILHVEALLSRFLATVILALVITGFFALLYQYISESFPLFLLNSFLISFAILVLWSPLVSLFRFMGTKIFKDQELSPKKRIEKFQLLAGMVTDVPALERLLKDSFKEWFDATDTKLVTDLSLNAPPRAVESYLLQTFQRKGTPILHRELLRMERDQVLMAERRADLDFLIHYLDSVNADIAIPIFHMDPDPASGKAEIHSFVFVSTASAFDDLSMSLGFYSRVFEAIQELDSTLMRLVRIEAAKERDRLALLGEMAAGLAHEVRNPLGAIRGAAALIDPGANVWAKVIHEEVDRLNRLVSQFLDFSHAPKDKPEVLNLVQIIEATLQNLKPACTHPVQIEFNAAVPVIKVLAVPDHLQQVLINLIQNAYKAVDERVASDGLAKGSVVIEAFEYGFRVRDNGIGMAQSTLDRVFQPFYTSFKNGSGLGLAICQRLIHFSHGRIRLESEFGKGTEVTVELRSADA